MLLPYRKLSDKSKLVGLVQLHVLLAFTVLLVESINLLPKREFRMTSESIGYTTSTVLIVITISASLFVMTNITRNIFSGFYFHIVVEILQTISNVGYSSLRASRRQDDGLTSDDDTSKLAVGCSIVIFTAIVEICLIKQSILCYRRLAKSGISSTDDRQSISTIDQNCYYTSTNFGNDLPPSYSKVTSSDYLPSYQEAVHKI